MSWYDRERSIEIASESAVWFHSGKAAVPIRWVLLRDPQGKVEPQALLGTDLRVEPLAILHWFILRCCLEVTLQEARAQLGVESQRQYSDLAITRTTPLLFALFSLVTLAAHGLYQEHRFNPRHSAWYPKSLATFSDALATLRERLWRSAGVFDTSSSTCEIIKLPLPLYQRLLDTLCYAA